MPKKYGAGPWRRDQKEPGDVAVRDIIDMLCSIPEDLLLPVDAEVMLDALNNPEMKQIYQRIYYGIMPT